MSPHQRWRVVEAIAAQLPDCAPMADCSECDPHGGCPAATECREAMAVRLLDVIENEIGRGV